MLYIFSLEQSLFLLDLAVLLYLVDLVSCFDLHVFFLFLFQQINGDDKTMRHASPVTVIAIR